MHAAQHDEQRVTVGLSLRERIGRDDTARTGAVVDDDSLTEALSDHISVQPNHGVGTAPGWLTAQDQDGPRGIVLRVRCFRQQDKCCRHAHNCPA